MPGVVFELHRAPPPGLGKRLLDRVGHRIGVEHDLRVCVPGGPPDGLDQAPGVAEEPLLIGVENPHEPDLRDVEALPQEVDPDKDVVFAEAELTDDLGPLEGIDLGMKVAGLDPLVGKVFREFFSEPFCERRQQHPVAAVDGGADLGDNVRDLALDRPDLDRRVHEPRRPDDLLRDA